MNMPWHPQGLYNQLLVERDLRFRKMLFLVALAFQLVVLTLGEEPHPTNVPPPPPPINSQNCTELMGDERWMKPEDDPLDPFFFNTPSCYRFVNKPIKNCSEAFEYCRRFTAQRADGVIVQARLVEIYSAEENVWIWSKISKSRGNRYIGMHVNPNDHSDYWWDSGHPVTYTNWAVSELNINEPNEDCVVIRRRSGTWWTIPGHKIRKFICEIKVLVFVRCDPPGCVVPPGLPVIVAYPDIPDGCTFPNGDFFYNGTYIELFDDCFGHFSLDSM
ncbi:hypothetical protein ScPMuIL_004143 [Solemya velum]